jgi:Secretion system C-terminal sorting domain
MKKLFLALCFTGSAVWAIAQTITAAEYFVDTDPGAGNGTAIPVTTPGATVNLAATVPTASLSQGFHIVAIRARTNTGQWGLYEKTGFYISTATANAGNITAAEYFVDTDPGAGNGVPVAVSAGTTVNFVATVPTVALSNGFHFITIRTRDTDGKWGLFEKAGFYISTATGNAGNITAAEFFVDNDPGTGNGTALSVTTGVNVNFVAAVPTASLSNGFHFVAIRTRDADGKWGLFEKAGFYISTATSNAGNIVAAEFFVDTDPGTGNGTAIPVSAGTNVNFTASVPTSALTPGFHFVAIRTRDADGKWGLFEKAGFYISTQTANSAGMTEAEYFIDTDPGVGNGTPFTIPGGQSFSQSFLLNIPAGTSNGNHFLAIRVKNGWGLFDFDTINVSGTLPLQLLGFEAIKNQNTVSLKWKTENEVNTSHFEVERSSNGTVFEKIGTITSANASGIHSYTLDDLLPFKGVNFYRLKQVDRDGRSTYSSILRVLFTAYGKPLTVYPNPARDFVRLDFSGKQQTALIQVYDAQGRQVMSSSMPNRQPLQLDVRKLPAGKYTVQVSDGETVATGQILRQ